MNGDGKKATVQLLPYKSMQYLPRFISSISLTRWSRNSELAIWTENNGKNNQKQERTLGKTGTQETRNLLDETLGSDESIVLASKLFDELLVLVQLPEVLGGHGIETVVLGTVKVVLVTKNTIISKFIRQLSMPFSLSS